MKINYDASIATPRAVTTDAVVKPSDFRQSFNRAQAKTADAAVPYVVKNGDTLAGIARNALIARGLPATPQTALRAALQLAEANDIRNPDLIRPGQTLDLRALNAVRGGDIDMPVAAQRGPVRPVVRLNDTTPVTAERSDVRATNHPVLERTLERAVTLRYIEPGQKDAVRDKILALADEHKFAPDHLAIVMLMESDGMNPRASNGRCHGVIQFCDGTNRGAASVGYADNPRGILNLGVLDQLDLVGKYFDETGLKNYNPANLDDLYLTVLKPVARKEKAADANLDIPGQQATALYANGDRNGKITRASLLAGLYQNAQDKLAAAVPRTAKTVNPVRVSTLDVLNTTRLR